MRAFKISGSMFLLLINSFACLSVQADESTPDMAAKVFAQNRWMAALSQCPVDVMTWRRPVRVGRNICASIGEQSCLRKCQSGSANECYWLGQSIQGKVDESVSDALFQRSCSLGIASGCTNRAAGIFKHAMDDQSVLACTHRTFERTCILEDPWGCTMQALQLSRGMGVEENDDEALRVLKGSCLNGDDDPACQAGEEIRQGIKAAKKR